MRMQFVFLLSQWLSTFGALHSLAVSISYLSNSHTSSESEVIPSEEEGRCPDCQAEFVLPIRESRVTNYLQEGLVNGGASLRAPLSPANTIQTASLREVGNDKDTSSSVQEIDRRAIPSATSVQVISGNYHHGPHTFIDHKEAPQARVRDNPPKHLRRPNSEEELLIPETPPSYRKNNTSHKSFCHRHQCGIACGGFVSILIAFLFTLLAVFFLLVLYPSHVDTRPREVELRPYEGAAVVCGQDHWLIKKTHLEQNTSADDYDGVYNVGVYSASDEELEKLKQTRFSNFSEDDGFQLAYSRTALPRGTANRLPYLMPGSTVTVNICLESNRDNSLNNAHLFVFSNRFAYSDYIHDLTNSTSDAVYNSSLEIGTNGRGICTQNEYPVTRKSSGYYDIILDIPSYQNVIVNYSISAHVVYIDSSTLPDPKSCQIPCSVYFTPSYHERTLLCFLHKSITIPYTAYLIAESKVRFAPLGTKIGGFGLLAFSVTIIALSLVILLICCIVVALKKF